MPTALSLLCCLHLFSDVTHKILLTAFVVLGSGVGFVNLKLLKNSRVLDLTPSIYIFWIVSAIILLLYVFFLIALQFFFYIQSKTRLNTRNKTLYCSMFRVIFLFYTVIYCISFTSALVLYIKVVQQRSSFDIGPSLYLGVYDQMVPGYYHPCLDSTHQLVSSKHCVCAEEFTINSG